MKSTKNVFLAILFLLLINTTRAADLSSTSYCNYDENKAEAERLLDQSPSIVGAFGRNNTATSNVFAVGVTESLSKYLQGNLSHKIGDADCHLYQVTSEIQKHVTYDLQSLQLRESKHRLELTETGIRILESMILEEKQRLNAGTSTLQNVATLEASRQMLVVSKSNLEQQIAIIILPEIDDERLDSLLTLANMYMLEEQQLIAKQSKYQNWDIAVTVGEGTNPNLPLLHSLPNETFATAQFTYSFGTAKRNRALDNAAISFTQSQEVSSTGPINLARLLRTQVQQARDAASGSVNAYEAYASSLVEQHSGIADVDTTVARAFRIQLEVANINNNIELSANRFARTVMDNYLAANFGVNE